ncbi:TetR family transcriptional regulator [Mumia flava]|uniref:TetR family transcriptional regulator n=1 Tax=Mumia flava TaxID=1348852 RepID=A0A2M9BFJ2_9ACTN|nr:TetR/AcrR family transcriptional regulator [Mumia flava]PJJ56718.1 TetR family transcriptional regulator [Mumia flava]
MRISAEQRREQLIEAALSVAKREGVGAVSTRTVAAEAGATPGIVHYVFSSMDELLRAMIQRLATSYVTTLEEVEQSEPPDVVSMLERALEQTWATVEADPEAHLLTFEVTQHALRNPAFADFAAWQYETYRQTARAVFERVATVCEIEWTVSLDLLSRMLVATNDGVVMAWLVDRDSQKAREVYGAFIDQVVAFARPAQRSVDA